MVQTRVDLDLASNLNLNKCNISHMVDENESNDCSEEVEDIHVKYKYRICGIDGGGNNNNNNGNGGGGNGSGGGGNGPGGPDDFVDINFVNSTMSLCKKLNIFFFFIKNLLNN